MRQPDFWLRMKRPPPPTERRLHIAVADHLRVGCKPGWWWSHIPSGEYRTKETGALLTRMGLVPGMYDFLLINGAGLHHWMELKRATGSRVSDNQYAFTEMLRLRGIPHAIVRGYDQAVAQLKTWGAL